MKCNICYAWRPKQWETWRFVDAEAQCSVHNKITGCGDTCPQGAIVKPATVAKRATAAKQSSTESDLSAWYEQHEAEFDFIKATNAERELFKHQQEDVDRHSASTEIALFNEMGTGKSAVAIRIAGEKYLRGEIDTLLIVAPNGVHKQWAIEEIPKWLQPEIPRQIQCFGGRGGAKFTRPFYDEPGLKILCTNIDTFSTPKKWKDITDWANATKCFIVLDEATCIKSVKSKRTDRMLYEFNTVKRKNKRILSSKPNTVARAVLTGTPVTNGPMDLWAIGEFLRPNFFGRNWYSFQNYYAMHTVIDVETQTENGETRHNSIPVLLNEERWQAIKEIQEYGMANAIFGVSVDTFNTIHSQDRYEGPYKHAEELRKMLEPIASFRLLKDCIDMPPQNYVRKLLQMNDDIAQCYYDMESELLAEYQDKMATAKNKITAIIRLQQISSGFISSTPIQDETEQACETCDYWYQDECEYQRGGPCELWAPNEFQLKDDYKSNEITWIGKSNPKLDALYDDVAESAKPVIIVTHFTAEAERIYEDLKDKYHCCLMTGWKKVGTMEEFKQGVYDICIANIRVISRGFNMQNSYTMLFYSNTFSLEDRLQVEGRIWRIGQKEICQYIDYVYEDTVDMKIVAALRQKRSLLDYIRGVSTKSFLTEQDEVFQVEYAEVYPRRDS
jgi:SNF2 family DNA or RNA helicase